MMKLQRSLYKSRDASNIWFVLITKKLAGADLQLLDSVPCVLTGDEMVLVCYVDDLLVFRITDKDVLVLQDELRKHLIMEALCKPASFHDKGHT